jgi:glycosyltransferase involved in cell wall biosynthesis
MVSRLGAQAGDMDSLRVALIGPLPPPAGGMANQTRQLAELLRGEGVQVHLVRANAPHWPSWVASVRGVRAVFRLLPYVFALWQAMGRTDVVHVMANSGWSWHLFAAPAIWIANLRRVPVIVNYRGGDAERFFTRSFRWVRPTLERADTVVVPSGFLQDLFTRFGVAVTVVPNIVDLARFHVAPALVKPPHIIVTRNLEPIYDIGTAIRAFRIVRERLPNAKMTIAGVGDEFTALRALAEELGVLGAITFTGRIDNRDIPALYHSAAVLLNPSTVDNMPISILEGWASGVPVVSTNVGGIPFLVNEGQNALLVDPGNPEQMAEAALRVLTSPALCSSLAASGRAAAERFCWRNVREQWFEVYRSLAPSCDLRASGAVGE